VACPSIGKESEIESAVLNQVCDEFQISDTQKIEKTFEEDFMSALKYMMTFLGRKFSPSLQREDCFESAVVSKIIKKVFQKIEQKGETGLDHFGIEVIEEEFQRKFGEPLSAAILSARSGNKEALFRLIRIDPQFLSEPWVQNIIKFASVFGDTQLIKRIGESLSAHRGLFGEIRDPLFRVVCFMKNLDLLGGKSNAELQDILEETGILARGTEEAYLSKKFRRHGIKQGERGGKSST
jgi:hypothetical protein